MKFLLSLFAAALLGVSSSALAAGDNAVEGVVQSVSGDTLTVKTDEGRTTIVDASQVDARRVALGASRSARRSASPASSRPS